jgi:hypothetical protein
MPIPGIAIPNVSINLGKFLEILVADNAFIDSEKDKLTFKAEYQNGNVLPSWLKFDEDI